MSAGRNLRTVVIHRSLNRPELFMGGEREPMMCITLLCGIAGVFGIIHMEILLLLVVAVLYFGGVAMFKRMAKIDPLMSKVWQRFMRYQTYYPARTSAWCQRQYRL